MTARRILVTSALPYANGPLHIGHIAGAYLPADLYVRYLRLRQRDVLFVCGSDEHGAAITLRAKKEGISPREIIDKYHQMNRDAFAAFGIDFDIYHRTSDPSHHEMAQSFFKTSTTFSISSILTSRCVTIRSFPWPIPISRMPRSLSFSINSFGSFPSFR